MFHSNHRKITAKMFKFCSENSFNCSRCNTVSNQNVLSFSPLSLPYAIASGVPQHQVRNCPIIPPINSNIAHSQLHTDTVYTQ